MNNNKCVVILSAKSSGSSICQRFLGNFADINHLNQTRHYQNESLYWTKAASILDMPQANMLDSEVPIPKDLARKDLINILRDNIESFDIPKDDKKLIFDGWVALCKQHSPIFLEKSPHHLYQWSALELMLEAIQYNREIDWFFIGLVRNPVDVLYSAFSRWKTIPEILQYEWFVSYQNLRRMAENLPGKILIIRYEDMVSSIKFLQPVFDFCEVKMDECLGYPFHHNSIQKWKENYFFGFELDNAVLELAKTYGYDEADLINRGNFLWPAYKRVARARHKATIKSKAAVKRVLSEFHLDGWVRRRR